jgi:hypothetical protein
MGDHFGGECAVYMMALSLRWLQKAGFCLQNLDGSGVCPYTSAAP